MVAVEYENEDEYAGGILTFICTSFSVSDGTSAFYVIFHQSFNLETTTARWCVVCTILVCVSYRRGGNSSRRRSMLSSRRRRHYQDGKRWLIQNTFSFRSLEFTVSTSHHNALVFGGFFRQRIRNFSVVPVLHQHRATFTMLAPL